MIPIATGPAQKAVVRVMKDGDYHTSHELIDAIYPGRKKKMAVETLRHTILDLRRKGYNIRFVKRGRWIMDAMPVVTIKKLGAPERKGASLNALQIAAKAAQDAGFTLDELRGPSRKAPLVKARWRAIGEMRKQGYSLTRIGNALGNRDHTTILYALKRMKAWVDANPL